MAIEVFNRFENKYLLDANKFEKFERRLTEYMEPDVYNQTHDTYSITNLYYDTVNNHFIRTSLAKPLYKEKLRLRAYGVPQGGSRIYAEIKKKMCGLTNKRRSALELVEAYDYLKTGAIPNAKPYMNMQVLHEIEYMLEQHSLQPALYLAYDRRAYFAIGEHDLRVSFDCNIRSRRTELRLEDGDFGEPLIGKDTWLMEVKSAQSIPLWLAHLLSEFEIYPTSFSKYGVEYMRTLNAGKPTEVFRMETILVGTPTANLATA